MEDIKITIEDFGKIFGKRMSILKKPKRIGSSEQELLVKNIK